MIRRFLKARKGRSVCTTTFTRAAMALLRNRFGWRQWWLFGFFGFEKSAGLCEVEGVSVYDEFVVARVVGDLEDAFYLMAALAESFDEKIDIYHAGSVQEVFCLAMCSGWRMRFWNSDRHWVRKSQSHNGLCWEWRGVSGGVRGFFSHALRGGVS